MLVPKVGNTAHLGTDPAGDEENGVGGGTAG